MTEKKIVQRKDAEIKQKAWSTVLDLPLSGKIQSQYKSQQLLGTVVEKVAQNLPDSPRKQNKIVSKLSKLFLAGPPCENAIKLPKPLLAQIAKEVKEFFCLAEIPTQCPGLKVLG